MSEINLAELFSRVVELEKRVAELELEKRKASRVITTTAPASTKAYIKRMGDKR